MCWVFLLKTSLCSACGGPKRAADTTELELQMIVSHHGILGMELGPPEEQPVLLAIGVTSPTLELEYF